LLEITNDSKNKTYEPYIACLEKDKIKVKMTEGISSGQQNGNFPVNEGPYNSTPHGKKRFNLLRKIPNQHETKIEFDKLYN
jgi:hypothetical protein